MTRQSAVAARDASPFAILAVLLLTVMLVAVAVGVPDHSSSSFADGVGALDADEVPNGWAPHIEDAARESGVPAPVLAAQLETESSWRPEATSPVGAQGLAQFMPETWDRYGQGEDPHEPEHAIDAQGRYLGDLLEQAETSDVSGDPLVLALAGYNAGFGAVEEHKGVPPYPETEDYLSSIRARTSDYVLPA